VTNQQTWPKVMIIGLDGMEPELVAQWHAEGRLPNIGRLIDEGIFSPLRSTVPPTTAPAWTTVLTGCNEGRHGTYDFRYQEPGTYRVQLAHDGLRSAPTMWEHLSGTGTTFASVEVPCTYPPPSLEGGVIVSGMEKPNFTPQSCNPPELYAELRAAGLEDLWHYNPDFRDKLDWDKLVESMQERVVLTEYLTRNHPAALYMQVLMPTDHYAHLYFGKDEVPLTDGGTLKQPLRSVYELVDDYVGQILDKARGPETNLIVLSDHGFWREDFTMNVSAWLREEGYLKLHATRNLLSSRVARSLKRVLPGQLKHLISRTRAGQRSLGMDFEARFDWPRTRAYCWGMGAKIRINVRGREPQGIVEPGAEYDELRETIIAQLTELRNPTSGKPVFKRVWRREELYEGPRVEDAHDIVGEASDNVSLNSNLHDPAVPVFFEKTPDNLRVLAGVINKPLTPGQHSSHGVLILHGPAFDSDRTLTEVPGLADVAPTAMHLVGADVPGGMDGRVLEDVLEDAWKAEHPVTRGDAATRAMGGQDPRYTEQEEEQVAQRLRNLGYL